MLNIYVCLQNMSNTKKVRNTIEIVLFKKTNSKKLHNFDGNMYLLGVFLPFRPKKRLRNGTLVFLPNWKLVFLPFGNFHFGRNCQPWPSDSFAAAFYGLHTSYQHHSLYLTNSNFAETWYKNELKYQYNTRVLPIFSLVALRRKLMSWPVVVIVRRKYFLLKR